MLDRVLPLEIDFRPRWLNQCPVCGKEQKKPFEHPLGFCSRSCKIFSLLEQFEDQTFTNRMGIDKFDEGEFLFLLQEDLELSLTKSELLAIADILRESNNQNLLDSMWNNSRYWLIQDRLNSYFEV